MVEVTYKKKGTPRSEIKKRIRKAKKKARVLYGMDLKSISEMPGVQKCVQIRHNRYKVLFTGAKRELYINVEKEGFKLNIPVYYEETGISSWTIKGQEKLFFFDSYLVLKEVYLVISSLVNGNVRTGTNHLSRSQREEVWYTKYSGGRKGGCRGRV